MNSTETDTDYIERLLDKAAKKLSFGERYSLRDVLLTFYYTDGGHVVVKVEGRFKGRLFAFGVYGASGWSANELWELRRRTRFNDQFKKIRNDREYIDAETQAHLLLLQLQDAVK